MVNRPPANDLPGPAWRAAEVHGRDMTLLEESLGLTPAERLRQHDLAVTRLEVLEVAMRKAGHGHGPTS
jgi:hypothetical protein